jgi:hypothetical protein
MIRYTLVGCPLISQTGIAFKLGAKPFNYMGLKALFCLLTHPAPASSRRPSLLKERGKAPKVRRGESIK